ncbi:MAG TPA: acyl-CoA dehydrogenase family protein [Myxococcota bacterium]|jgi:alkylation response protein AidB-like acyl-CoA dehydrogenase
MDLSYGPEYAAFRDEVRAFLREHGERAPKGAGGVAAGRAGEALLAWQKLLIEHGYAARTIPKQYGGHGGDADILKRVIIDEEFNAAGVSRGIGGQGPEMLVPTLLEHGSEAQKQRWIGPTIRGETVWCQGYSEPGAGSDLANVQTRAVEDGGDFLISGQKIWTTTAHLSDMMFGLIRTEPGASKHAGLSYLLIPMDTPGIQVRPLATMTGEAEFNEVFFDQARVPQASVVGKRGEGWKIANTTLFHERNMLASSAVLDGGLRSLVKLMQRETSNGVRAIDSPVLRDRLGRLEGRVLAMKYHGMRMLTARLAGKHPGVAALVTKLAGCELSHQLNALALDAMGELGALYEGSAHERDHGRWQSGYMFTLGLIIGGGTAQIQKNIISERGLGMPREPKPQA